MNVKVRYYATLDSMPPATRKAVRTMGYSGGNGGVLRDIAANSKLYRYDGGLVIYENGEPAGWGVLYSFVDTWGKRRKTELGFWIRMKHRKKGYGLRLIMAAHKRWGHMKVGTFDSVEPVWNAWNIMARIRKKKANKS